jgi:hypothetical protein
MRPRLVTPLRVLAAVAGLLILYATITIALHVAGDSILPPQINAIVLLLLSLTVGISSQAYLIDQLGGRIEAYLDHHMIAHITTPPYGTRTTARVAVPQLALLPTAEPASTRQRRRRRRSALPRYMSDAAETYELGRQAGRQERQADDPPA